MRTHTYTIAVVTGTRAEFGLLHPVADAIERDPGLRLQLVVTGAHLCASLGNTRAEIEQTGLPVALELDILRGDPATPPALGIARAVEGLFAFWSASRPDLVLLLGDRYETFAAATAAASLEIPIAHIGGGDTTEGAKDEYYRHSVTKMSALHFPLCESSRRRIIQLGEQPDTVVNAGSLGAQNILSVPPVPVEELSADVGFDMARPFLLCTLHPETLGGIAPRESARLLLRALEKAGLPVLFTAANADEGGAQINDAVAEFCAKHGDARLVQSLGMRRYLSAMRYCAAVVGNSSSAVVETPTLKKPAVNIGERQRGRETGANNIDAPWDEDAIAAAVRKAVSPEFAASLAGMKSPYGEGDASGTILRAVKAALARGISAKKKFYDIEFEV